MANGALSPSRGVPEDDSVLTLQYQNEETMRRYYARVWRDQDLKAIDDLVAENFVIHRDKKVLSGRAALKNQVTETLINFLNLRVDIEEMVSLREIVATRLNVWHKTVRGEWVRFKGVDISTVVAGQITETSVKYAASEIVPTDEALKLIPA